MARRSLGVVLIVTLLGWTVNQPLECQGRHSRAAVMVPAGASPANQPEPSPTPHSCCPRERSRSSPARSQFPPCHRPASSHPDCCSFTGGTQSALTFSRVQESLSTELALTIFTGFGTAARSNDRHFVFAPLNFPGVASPSFTVLRL